MNRPGKLEEKDRKQEDVLKVDKLLKGNMLSGDWSPSLVRLTFLITQVMSGVT